MKFVSKKSLKWQLPVLIVAILVIALARYFSAPSQGSQAVSRGGTPSLPQAAQTAAETIESDYFSLRLPAGYKPQAAQPVAGLLYSRTIIKPSTNGSLVINIGIKTMPEGGLAGDSSFRLRQQKPERYSLSNQTVDGELVHIANDAEAAAVVAFWPHGGYLATISVASGIDNPAAADNVAELKALQPLLDGWQWR